MFSSTESTFSNGLGTGDLANSASATEGYATQPNADGLRTSMTARPAQSLPGLPAVEVNTGGAIATAAPFLRQNTAYREYSAASTTAAIASASNSSVNSSAIPSEDALLFGGPGSSANSSSSRSSQTRQRGLSQSALNRAVGTFTAGKNGQVNVDFLFDGSAKTGELAIFSLDGMGGLKRKDFIQEASRRALSGSRQGQIVIKDKTEAAQFSGSLGDRDFNKGRVASTQTARLSAREKFAVMLVPTGTVADVRAGKRSPLFSIAQLNAKGRAQIAKAGNTVFAMEDARVNKSKADFNDVIFQIRGATGNAKPLQQLVNRNKDWRNTPTAKAFLNDPSAPPNPGPIDPPAPENPNPGGGKIVRDISNSVSKFSGSSTKAQIIASGANSITIGTQTIYIGTEQVTSINQNPIMRSFDAKNPKNNWTRRDTETSGTDGRGYGLLWTGKALYGVFSVDGTQNDGKDFRAAASGAQQNWLKSYGPGGGARIGVITQLDRSTGKLLKAAHLSAITSSGRTNSLDITDATVNSKGNLVVKAKSFFSPRQPDGSAKRQNPGNNAGSPFDYTVEITSDLKRVLKTTAPGWS